MDQFSTTNESGRPRARTPNTPALVFRRLSPACGRGVFSCGDKEIDRWFRTQALDEHLNHRCRVVTAELSDDPSPVGFFAMCIRLEKDDELDPSERAHNRSDTGYFPSVQLSSVAVHASMQRQGIGTV